MTLPTPYNGMHNVANLNNHCTTTPHHSITPNDASGKTLSPCITARGPFIRVTCSAESYCDCPTQNLQVYTSNKCCPLLSID